MTPPRHPAKYSDALLPVLQAAVRDPEFSCVLDPFAGTGKIHQLTNLTVGVELEPEWAEMHPDTLVGNALDLPFGPGEFDAVVTSPTYGNRMADHHNAKDTSKRNTYRHALGRELHDDNSGAMQWGPDYREFHKECLHEMWRVLRDGGRLVINMKDHIRKGVRQEVTAWWKLAAVGVGFQFIEEKQIPLQGNGFGANGHVRTEYESVLIFVKPKVLATAVKTDVMSHPWVGLGLGR